MPQDTSKQELNEDVKKLAERIVSYETREKGAMGNLFAFEARDGFWSKLMKTLGPVVFAINSAALTFIAVSSVVAGPVGLAAAGVAAAATGLLSGAIARAVNHSIFSDLHDSHKGNLGKFGHYLGIGLVGSVVAGLINAFAPGIDTLTGTAVALASGMAVVPLVNVMTSKGIASGLGDQQLRNESAAARGIAQQAIQSGQSVEQLLDQEKSANPASGHLMSETQEKSPEKSYAFTKMVEQQRANQQTKSIV